MKKLLTMILGLFLCFSVVFYSCTQISAEEKKSNSLDIEEQNISTRLNQEEIDELLGPDPYLYDSANVMDYSGDGDK